MVKNHHIKIKRQFEINSSMEQKKNPSSDLKNRVEEGLYIHPPGVGCSIGCQILDGISSHSDEEVPHSGRYEKVGVFPPDAALLC